MRKNSVLATAAVLGLSATLAAPVTAQTREAWRPDAKGKMVKVQLTGKYSDCIRDGLKMHYSPDAVKKYCDGRPGLRR